MVETLAVLATRLDGLGLRVWASDAYPTINTLHLLGLVMLVGGIGVVDLRTMGLWRALPLPALSRALTPVAIAGLAIMATTGVLLFASDGAALAQSDTFRTKLLLIAAALANAVAYRILWRRSTTPPVGARIMAGVSLILWLAVGTWGRMVAYS